MVCYFAFSIYSTDAKDAYIITQLVDTRVIHCTIVIILAGYGELWDDWGKCWSGSGRLWSFGCSYISKRCGCWSAFSHSRNNWLGWRKMWFICSWLNSCWFVSSKSNAFFCRVSSCAWRTQACGSVGHCLAVGIITAR